MEKNFATDFVNAPSGDIDISKQIKQGYKLDIVVFFPRCFVSEICPAQRYRGYFLCNDTPEKRCEINYRQNDNIKCRLGDYALKTKQIFAKYNLKGKVLVIPGGRQIIDVCLVEGIPIAAVGVACPPDLKEGRIKLDKIGTKAFLVPLTKLEYDIKNIKKTTIQSCYENVIKNGIEKYLSTLEKAIVYIKKAKAQNYTINDYIKQKPLK